MKKFIKEVSNNEDGDDDGCDDGVCPSSARAIKSCKLKILFF